MASAENPSTPGVIAGDERSLERERARRITAPLVVVCALVALELWVRAIPLERLVFRTERNQGTRVPAVQAIIRDGPEPADVLIVGSSRARDGIAPLVMAQTLEHAGTADVRVRSYAIAGSHIEEMHELVRDLLAVAPPRVLVVGVEPRAVSGDMPVRWDDMTTLPEWWSRLLRGDPRSADRLGPALHNHFCRSWRTAAFRDRFREALIAAAGDAASGDLGSSMRELSIPAKPSPMTGGEPWNHIEDPERSLANRPRNPRAVRRYVERLYPDERFAFTPRHRDAIVKIVRDAGAHGTRVLFVEVPAPDILREQWFEGTESGFREVMRSACSDAGAPFVRYDSLGLTLGDEHFREHSHLNRAGARLFTQRLTERAVVPVLTPKPGAGPGTLAPP